MLPPLCNSIENKDNNISTQIFHQVHNLQILLLMTQKILEFHRGLATLENILCNVCLEKFPSIKADTTGVCIHGRNDTEVPGLYSPANNTDPGQVPNCV